jgi:DUF438 domain-containing protein
MTSYIAVHSDKGIYLGVIAGHAIFSSNNMVESTKAIRFNSKNEIMEFFRQHIPSLADKVVAIPVQTTSTTYYVDIVDIIKSGYREHTESMFANLFTDNETMH